MTGPSTGRLAPSEREALIDRYRDGHRAVLDALAGTTEDELNALPAAPDTWTARMVVHHLADSEMMSAMRLRRLIADEHPVIEGYDEPRFARRLFYDDRPIEPALAALAAARATTLQILERLSDEQWAREGVHTESGRYGVEEWLRIYAAHAHDHADQIRRAISVGRA
ncbi:MAG TPA: DinB family protein [Candidatus Limnocylindrales bacterium]